MLAQEHAEKPKHGKFYALGGVHFFETANLNQKLAANDIPELNPVYASYGIGAAWQSGKWLFGAEAMSLSGSGTHGETTNDIKVSATIGMGYLYTGYRVLDSGKCYLTPRIGIGGSGVTVLINQKSETTLDGFLSERSANNLKTGGALIHSGLKLGFRLSNHWDMNLDLGYNFAIANKWDASYGSLTESVEDGIGGAFMHITIGYVFN